MFLCEVDLSGLLCLQDLPLHQLSLLFQYKVHSIILIYNRGLGHSWLSRGGNGSVVLVADVVITSSQDAVQEILHLAIVGFRCHFIEYIKFFIIRKINFN